MTVHHKNVQSNVPVRHIIVSLYCWHSNVNKPFEIEISSQQNVNSLNTIYFKEGETLNADRRHRFLIDYEPN